VSDAVNELIRTVALFLPELVAFLVILLVGWIVARLVGKAVKKILQRVGFERAIERGGMKRALGQGPDGASGLVGRLVYYVLLLVVLQMAFGVFGPNPISALLTGVIAFIPLAVVAIIIVVITVAIATAVRELISTALGGLSYGRTLANIAAGFILGIGVIAALNQVGVATTVTTPILIAVLTAVVGVIVVGVGGGLIKPMQTRWESYLVKAEQEAPKVKEQATKAPSVAEQAGKATTQFAPAVARDGGDTTHVYDQADGGAHPSR